MGRNTRIDWADASWNPVTGCLHGCQYCYAKRIAERFGLKYAPKLGDPGMEGACKYDTELGQDTMLELEKPYVDRDGVKSPYPMAFLPTFHKYRLDIPKTWKRPRNIFVCSMADLFGEWVPDEVIQAVINACKEAPQHRYLFLTKNPERYQELLRKDVLLGNESNFWLGSTTTKSSDLSFRLAMMRDRNHREKRVKVFASIEPILERFTDRIFPDTDWVIIGAETGNRKNKVIPKKEWITEITDNCHEYNTPVFMKESLREIMGEDFIQEFPWR